MKLHLGYLSLDYGHLDDLLPDLAYREEIDISSELVPSGRILDDHFFEELISNDLNDDIHEYVYQTYEDIMNNIIAEVNRVELSVNTLQLLDKALRLSRRGLVFFYILKLCQNAPKIKNYSLGAK